MGPNFRFHVLDYVRIKDYNRHGIITERLNGQSQPVYGVIEPNLRHFYWLENDLSPYPNPLEGLQNVPDGNEVGQQSAEIRDENESRMVGMQGRFELQGPGMSPDDREDASGSH